MQVKKFEAPTIQEALEVIKRELGPEAIILQTRKMKKGFGLMSRESVEVTAAVSERSMQKKSFTETRLRDSDREAVKKLSASKQGDMYDKYTDGKIGEGSHRPGSFAASRQGGGPPKKMTATRYADIDDARDPSAKGGKAAGAAATAAGAAARAQAQALQAQAQAKAEAHIQALAQSRLAEAHAQQQLLGRGPRFGAGAGGGSQMETLEAVADGRLSREGAGAVMGHLGAGMSVEEELRHLKRMIEEMRTTQEAEPGAGAMAASGGGLGALATPALQDAFEQLVLNGVDRRFAHALVKKTCFEIGDERSRNPEYVLDQLAVEVMQTTQIASPIADIHPRSGKGPVVIALVGPTGVGKTTTVAKLASEALLRRDLKVGLINLDSYKVAAFDQLGTYAKILNVPFRSAETAEDLRVAIRDFSALDLVLVDTTGRSQRDPGSLQEMQHVLGENVRTQLVLAVATRDNELYDQATRFGVFRPQGIIMSKLDEATMFGSIYNVSFKSKLPLLHFTTGQRVPEDIEEATKERVAALVMDL